MKRFYILLFVLILFSCENRIEWDLHSVQTNMIVVDGILTNEYKRQHIRITRPVYSLNERPDPVIGATVKISNKDTIMYLFENTVEKGVYYTTKKMTGSVGRIYNLQITSEGGRTYTAETYMLPVLPSQLFSYKASTDKEGMYEITSIPSTFNTEENVLWEIYMDWSHLPDYDYLPDDSCKRKMVHFSLQSLDVSQIFASEKEKVHFPEGTIIIQKKYSLNDDHAEYFRTMLLETDWRGGLFDEIPANVHTNLSKGAVGYFGASTVLTDTIVVN